MLTREHSNELASEMPIGRQTQLAEVAWTCAEFATPRSPAINGTVMHVDGGHSMIG